MAVVDLYWLPLGAGGHFVRLNGRVYEALAARLHRRPARDLYHAALQVELPEGTFVIEQEPVHDWSGAERGVVAEGAVGVAAVWPTGYRSFAAGSKAPCRRWEGPLLVIHSLIECRSSSRSRRNGSSDTSSWARSGDSASKVISPPDLSANGPPR
jgi:hypothetical protein